jgi:hypothetical protein
MRTKSEHKSSGKQPARLVAGDSVNNWDGINPGLRDRSHQEYGDNASHFDVRPTPFGGGRCRFEGLR